MVETPIQEVKFEELPEPESTVIVLTTHSKSVYSVAVVDARQGFGVYRGGTSFPKSKSGSVGSPPHLCSGMLCPGLFRVHVPACLGHVTTSVVESIEVKSDRTLADELRKEAGK